MAKPRNYAVAERSAPKSIPAPVLAYRPRDPVRYRACIGLIGCGGITEKHLAAYKAAGYDVAALCDVDLERAKARQRGFYPRAAVYSDYRELLRRDDIDVVDISTHPLERVPILRAAIDAGKHILSQKPFVLDLEVGQRLCDRADARGVRIAVNQNGRWAPNVAWMRSALSRGLIGQPIAVHMGVHWDHNWIKGTPFDKVRHIVLYDFGIHWFDFVTCYMGDRTPCRVYASNASTASQTVKPPLMGQVLIEYDSAQATIVFDADVRRGGRATTYIAGTRGTLLSQGPDIGQQTVTLQSARGISQPKLQGAWFPDGFHGTMSELLLSIEQKRQPDHSARHNLRSLGLCFAACASADAGRPMIPGRVCRLRS